MPSAPQSLLTSPFALLGLLLGLGGLGGPLLVCQQIRPAPVGPTGLPSAASHHLQRLTLETSRPNEGFGASVALYGKTALVGCPQRRIDNQVVGSAQLFTQDPSGRWRPAYTIEESDLHDGTQFGASVALGEHRAVVSVCARDVHTADMPAAYVYEEVAPHNWQRTASLSVEHQSASSLYSSAAALDADTAIIAHVGRDLRTERLFGMADVFRASDAGEWRRIARLAIPDERAIRDEQALPEATALPDENAAGLAHFGRSVALSGRCAIIGAPLQVTSENLAGAAYIFEESPRGEWRQTARLVADDARGADSFGISVAIKGRTALVGAVGADKKQNSGAAYLFRKTDAGQWKQVAKLTPDDAADWDNFGSSVSLDSDFAAIGAPGCNDGAGAVYVFRFDGMRATQIKKLTPPDAAPRSDFGRAVALAGNSVLSGAPAADHDNNPNTGAAYATLFKKGGAAIFATTGKSKRRRLQTTTQPQI
ncbi:MAG: FG-GAP repeat protein [Pirellulales bacterium]